MSLNDQIVAYLSQNAIAWAVGDFETGQPEGEPDQILFWDETKLGAQPSAEVLAAARPAVPVQPRHITRLSFRNRFTMAEKVALELAAVDDPSAPMADRKRAAAIRVSRADTAAAAFIDLDRPDTRAGVEMLESVGLLATGRAAEILDAPIADQERPV